MYRIISVVLLNLMLEVFARSLVPGRPFLREEPPVEESPPKTCVQVRPEFTPHTLKDPFDKMYCADKGLKNLKQYRHAIPLGDGRTFMPMYTSKGLTGNTRGSSDIKQAVIFIHGRRENANKFFCDAVYHTRDGHADHHTLTLVPWFSHFLISGAQWNNHSYKHSRKADKLVSACWSNHSWMGGGDSYNGNVTAFAVLDKIVSFLQTSSDAFPQLKRIVFVGFSAGCQMVSRWSFFSRSLLPGSGRADTTAILAACGAYMYLDDKRPAQHCSTLYQTGVEHNCSKFRRPALLETGTGQPCEGPDSDSVSLDFGRESRFAHEGYLRSFAEYPTLIQRTLDEFPSKDVRYLLGSSDVCSCNVAGYRNPSVCYSESNYTCMPNDFGGARAGNTCCDSGENNVLRHDCPALLQGSNRLQRGLNYVGYLGHFYRKRGVTFEPPVRIFDGGHDSTKCFASDRFRSWAFKDGNSFGSLSARSNGRSKRFREWPSESRTSA